MIEHGGNLKKYALLADCAEAEILDFSVNLNPDAGRLVPGLFSRLGRAWTVSVAACRPSGGTGREKKGHRTGKGPVRQRFQ